MAESLVLNNTRKPIFFQFPSLLEFPELFHAVFTREGGVSQGLFGQLNIGLAVGDDAENVEENRRRMIRRCEGLRPVFLRQVHGTRVVVIRPDTRDCAGTVAAAPLEADAAITDAPGLALAIQVADCQAVMFYDPVKRAVGNAHAGWRGSVGNILTETVARMAAVFGSDPKDLHAAIGPSLGPCCAEFVNYEKEIPRKYWSYRDPFNRFDFWAISRDQLTSAGIAKKNISVSGLCTRCRTDRFYSYRGEGATGRFAALVGLRG